MTGVDDLSLGGAGVTVPRGWLALDRGVFVAVWVAKQVAGVASIGEKQGAPSP